MGTATRVVVGIDVGTTATKAVVHDTDGHSHGHGEAGYPLAEPEPGAAVQDPEAVLEAVGDAVRDAVEEARQAGDVEVAGLAFSSAMHGLVGLDPEGHPLTPLITWADSRAADTARDLRAREGSLALHRRTGTPIHPMSPLVKLAWLRRARPSLHAAVHTWGGVKELVLARAVGARVTDVSCASGTGLWSSGDGHGAGTSGHWDPEALDLAGITAERLGDPVDTTAVVGGLLASDWGVPVGTPVVAGAGDGPLGNLGVGAVRPGVAACSIGTSGALRLTVDRFSVDPRGRTFCYALVPGRWVIGGAITNGGLVLDWARQTLRPDAGVEELLALAADVPAGCDGLLALPHLLGERAPRWAPYSAGALVGLHRAHTAGHVARALLEGVCLQLRLVLDSMREAGMVVDEVRATGGFAQSPFWRRLLTDALGLPVSFLAEAESTAFGAALLGMRGLGLLGDDDTDDVLARLAGADRVAETLSPGPDAAVLHRRLPLLDQVEEQLTAIHEQLRRS